MDALIRVRWILEIKDGKRKEVRKSKEKNRRILTGESKQHNLLSMQGNPLRLFNFICIINKYCYFHLYETLMRNLLKVTIGTEWPYQDLKLILLLQEGPNQKKKPKKNRPVMFICTFKIFISKQRTTVTVENPLGNYSQSGHWEMGSLPHCITANSLFLRSQSRGAIRGKSSVLAKPHLMALSFYPKAQRPEGMVRTTEPKYCHRQGFG